jgi:hypothetical protein
MPKPTANTICRCGHKHMNHDTGWDASGCMVAMCTCRAFVSAPKVPTAKELLAHLNTDFDCGAAVCVDCGALASRVEKVLAWAISASSSRRRPHARMATMILRILNGEE